MPDARPLDPADPRRLGDYEIAGRLGQGGQGVVLLGRSPEGRQVAIKLLHARLGDDPLARSRFIRELEVAKQVATFCTAAVLDADVAGDRPYIVSEYVAGPSLQELVASEGPRGRSALERLAIGTATALTAIHRAGVVHRDFKPANVLLGGDGPRVIDFGIARAIDLGGLTMAGAVPGTPSYLAPEQLGGAEVGPAADVFSWGATMLFAASGLMPFGNDTVPEVVQRILYDEPDLSGLPESLLGIVGEALAKDPAGRPTARQLLDRLLGQDAQSAGMPEPLVNEARTLASDRPPRPAPSAFDAPTRHYIGPPDPAPPTRLDMPPAMAPVNFDGSPGGGPAALDASEPGTAGYGGPFGRRAGDPAVGMTGRVGGPDVELGEPSGGPFDVPDASVPGAESAALGRQGGDTQILGGFGTGNEDLGFIPWGGSEQSFQPPAVPPARPRQGQRPLGVLVSIAVGVLAGAAIIVLVLWPHLRDPGRAGGPAGTSRPAADNRPVSSIPEAFAGTWTGTAVNRQRNATFQIEVIFGARRTTAEAIYPNGCACTLNMVRGTGTRLEMTLRPTDSCTTVTPGNVVVTRRADGTLDYAWSKPGTALNYQATLARR